LTISRLVSKVIPEKELPKYLGKGWVLKTQLQSGDAIMEKSIDVEKITNDALEQANKQITEEMAQVDVERITEKAMAQVRKQIDDAITKEKQRLL
jgi:copper chaperone CopZ